MIELRGTTWDHPRGWGGTRATADAFTRERADVRVTWETRSLQAFADHPIGELAATYDLIVLDHPSDRGGGGEGGAARAGPAPRPGIGSTNRRRRASVAATRATPGRVISGRWRSTRRRRWRRIGLNSSTGDVPATWEQVTATQVARSPGRRAGDPRRRDLRLPRDVPVARRGAVRVGRPRRGACRGARGPGSTWPTWSVVPIR